MSDYNVTFSVDGSLMLQANSAEAAERMAIDALEGLQLEADDTTIDGCSVRVSLEFTYDGDDEPDKCNSLDRPSRAVEFAL